MHIDATKGESVYSKVEGVTNKVKFPQDLIELLKQAKPNSVIQVHNHPRSSCFSLDDIRNLVYYDSLKAISVIGHDGTRYVMSIGKGQRIDLSTLGNKYNAFKKKHFDYFREQVLSGKMTEQQAWKEHSHRIVVDLVEEYGWEYRRVMPNEK